MKLIVFSCFCVVICYGINDIDVQSGLIKYTIKNEKLGNRDVKVAVFNLKQDVALSCTLTLATAVTDSIIVKWTRSGELVKQQKFQSKQLKLTSVLQLKTNHFTKRHYSCLNIYKCMFYHNNALINSEDVHLVSPPIIRFSVKVDGKIEHLYRTVTWLSWLNSFPKDPVATLWQFSTYVGKRIEVECKVYGSSNTQKVANLFVGTNKQSSLKWKTKKIKANDRQYLYCSTGNVTETLFLRVIDPDNAIIIPISVLASLVAVVILMVIVSVVMKKCKQNKATKRKSLVKIVEVAKRRSTVVMTERNGVELAQSSTSSI